MSKSTPLSQLPSMAASQNVLLNDPQRQQQSQANVQPQQAPPPMQDPDEIVQETLNQLNNQAMPPPPSLQQQTQSDSQYMSQQPYVYDPNIIMPTQQSFAPYASQEPATKLIKDLASWNDDLQIGLFAAAFYILISMTPIESIVFKYVALDKLPYSGVVIKAALMFVLMFVFVKFMK